MVLRGVLVWCWLAVGLRAAEDCVDRAVCEGQMDAAWASIRLRTVDVLQREVEDKLGSAPAAVESTDSQFSDGLMQPDMSAERSEIALLEHFWNQMNLFSDVDWLYYGDEATGNFVGLRKAYPCEVAKNCQYPASETPASPLPDVAAGSLVRLSYSGATQTFYAHTTRADGATGSDKVDLLYSDSSFRTRERLWYKQGAAASAETASNWTEPYVFSGGNYGVTVARKVVVNGTFFGVLAGDYELGFLESIARELVGGDDSASLFFATAAKVMLANTLGVPAVVNGAPVRFDGLPSSAALIRETATRVFASNAVLSDASADWTGVSSGALAGTFRLGATGQDIDWDAIAVFDMHWIVVLTRVKTAHFPATPACVGRVVCRNDLLRLTYQYREATVAEFRNKMLTYTSSPLAAVSTVEATYNNGNLHAGWCDPCGRLSYADAGHRRNLRNHLKHTLASLPEVAWLYVGFVDEGKVLGYRRDIDGTMQLWQSCDGTAATGCTGQGTSLIDERTDAVVSTSTEDPRAKAWWIATDTRVGLNDVTWTDEYVFSTGEVGVSAVKRLLGGDWDSAAAKASIIVAADVSLAFLTGFVASLGVPPNSYLFVINTGGGLIAANKGVPTTSNSKVLQASVSSDATVKSASKTVLAWKYETTEDRTSSYMIDPTGDEYVMIDAIKLTPLEGVEQFEWFVVMTSPEQDLYNEEALNLFKSAGGSSSGGGDGGGLPGGWKTVLVLIVLTVGGGAAYTVIKKRMANGSGSRANDPAPAFHNPLHGGSDAAYQGYPQSNQPGYPQDQHVLQEMHPPSQQMGDYPPSPARYGQGGQPDYPSQHMGGSPGYPSQQMGGQPDYPSQQMGGSPGYPSQHMGGQPAYHQGYQTTAYTPPRMSPTVNTSI